MKEGGQRAKWREILGAEGINNCRPSFCTFIVVQPFNVVHWLLRCSSHTTGSDSMTYREPLLDTVTSCMINEKIHIA